MKVPELRVIDKDFNLVGILDTYTSFQGERRAWEVGPLEMHIDLRAQGADACQIGNIVMIDENRAWEITSVRKTEGAGLSLVVTGHELKGFLGQRIVVPDQKDDSHHFGWDRVPDPDAPVYEPVEGEFYQDGNYYPGQTAAMITVRHGQNTNAERPIEALAVYWIGGMGPENARNGDLWYGSYEGLQLMAGGYFQTVEDGVTGGYFLPDYNRYIDIYGKEAYEYTLYKLRDADREVFDEITEDGFLIRRVGIMTLDGTEHWANSSLPVGFFYSTSAVNTTAAESALVACTRAVGYTDRTDADDKAPSCHISDDKNLLFNYSHIWDTEESLPDSVNTFKAELAAKANSSSPWVIYYELEHPTTTPLPHLGIPTEGIIKHYIEKHAAEPDDPVRKLPRLGIAPDLKRGALTKWSARFKSLTETLKDIGEYSGMGYTVRVDLENKRFVADVIPEQQTPVILSVDFENIQSLDYVNDVSRDISIAYAGGAGEDEDRLIQTVARTPAEAALSGYERREAWLECGSVDDIEDLIYEAQYQLAQQEETESLTCGAMPNTSFEYLKDWDIGSIVTVRSKALGLIQQQKVTAVKETYERGRIQITPTLGKRNKTILDEIRKTEVVK